MARVRYSLQYLQYEYDHGNKGPLEKLVRAWIGIQKLDPGDENSFFVIGGYHGEPFHGPGASNSNDWWGGYCNHGNVLFPTWHRAYIFRLENALRTVPGCEDVTLAFWDEYAGYQPDPTTLPPPNPIPAVLTSKTFPLDGQDVANPLYSYTLPKALSDSTDDKNRYDKPSGYTTVRFPLSGLVGPDDEFVTTLYNNTFAGKDLADILNRNVSNWLNQGADIPDDHSGARHPDTYSVGVRYQRCLDAPNYMVFSNTTSAAQWTQDHGLQSDVVVPLESPHNAIHLSVGGFFQRGVYEADPAPYLDSNGDMGENNTASLDPIFWFHHCFVDYAFWSWQKKQKLTAAGSLTVDMGYPGTNSSDAAPPAYQPPNTFLDMDTPLYPFKKQDKSWYTSHDVTDIVEQLGYTYGPGSLDPLIDPKPKASKPTKPHQIKRISGINRLAHKGSFVVRTQAIAHDGKAYEIGREEILSRWNVSGCKNCQTHLGVTSFVPIHEGLAGLLRGTGRDEDVKYVVKLQTRDGVKKVNAIIDDL